MQASELSRRINDAQAEAYPEPVSERDFATKDEYVTALEGQVRDLCNAQRRRSERARARLDSISN